MQPVPQPPQPIQPVQSPQLQPSMPRSTGPDYSLGHPPKNGPPIQSNKPKRKQSNGVEDSLVPLTPEELELLGNQLNSLNESQIARVVEMLRLAPNEARYSALSAVNVRISLFIRHAARRIRA